MGKLAGAKYKGTHTTLIDLATEVADIVTKLDTVTGIAAGIIQSGKSTTGGAQKVKIIKMSGGIKLTVRQSRSIQELFLYGPDVQKMMEAVARSLRNNDIQIHFT